MYKIRLAIEKDCDCAGIEANEDLEISQSIHVMFPMFEITYVAYYTYQAYKQLPFKNSHDHDDESFGGSGLRYQRKRRIQF